MLGYGVLRLLTGRPDLASYLADMRPLVERRLTPCETRGQPVS
jgi:hypothetical protein